MEKIIKQPLTSQAIKAIRDGIIVGHFEQGSRITEEGLADELGVSRICIREAILKLEDEGLIIKKPNQGTYIVKLEARDISDIFNMRLAIEKMSIKTLLKQNRFPANELYDITDDMEVIAMRDEIDPMDVLDADMAFHKTIVEEAGNTRAIKVWESLEGQMLTAMYKVHENFVNRHRGGLSAKEHRYLIETINGNLTAIWQEELEKHVLELFKTK